MRVRAIIGAALLALASAGSAVAQQPVTLPDAINAALTNGPRMAVARADSAAAAARIITAQAYPNPTAALSYTKSTPSKHIELEQSFELPSVRSARINAAKLGAQAANYGLAAERSSIRYEVEIVYANAAAMASIRSLAARNANDAVELLRITREREKAGDASELEVDLAQITAGQALNDAASDSLQATLSILLLQGLMGRNAQRVEILPVDTLDFAIAPSPLAGQVPLMIAAAQQQLASEQANLQLARAARIPAPALRVGVEWGESDSNQMMPLIGIAIPLPIWNRNKGPIAEAHAATARATAALQQAQLETQTALALAEQERLIARGRVERGRTIIQQAERVATRALTAYREGEYTLAQVIEARRSARDVVRQYILDVQSSRTAEAALVRAQVGGGARP